MAEPSPNIRKVDKSFLERLLDVVDDIEGNRPRTLVRRHELRKLLDSHGYDYNTVVGRWLIEELYTSIYCHEE